MTAEQELTIMLTKQIEEEFAGDFYAFDSSCINKFLEKNKKENKKTPKNS